MNFSGRRLAWAALLVASVSVGLEAFVFGPASLVVVEHTVPVPGWPPAAPLRVALLSDLHTGSPFNGLDKLKEIVRRTVAARPDLVLLAGDYVIKSVAGGRYETPESIEAILTGLRAPLGVYAVLGNHDYGTNSRRITRAMERAGVRVLSDEAVLLGGGTESAEGRQPAFWLVGVSDLLRGPHDLQGALSQVEPDGRPVILLTHNPDLFPQVPARITLTLAGHTHGGQVRLPLLGRPVVPSRYGSRYAAGHIVETGRHMFVSTGLGTSILPVRFLVPPEISLLTIEAAR